VMPIGKLEPEVAVLVKVGVVQLSDAVGVVHVATAVVAVALAATTVVVIGQFDIVGLTTSLVQGLNACTVILNEQLEVLPATSRAV
jgi:ABC-type thiamin/hydroxymethylpyrimidine transport system permease subunit